MSRRAANRNRKELERALAAKSGDENMDGDKKHEDKTEQPPRNVRPKTVKTNPRWHGRRKKILRGRG